MIALSRATALMIYLCFTLGAILLLWGFSHWRGKKKTIISLERELFVCEYCQSAYLQDASKEVTQCPDCRSYNKNNRFKKSTQL